MIFKAIRELFRANTAEGVRTFVNQGGTASAKTYTILQVLLYHAIRENGIIVTVCGQDLPNLKVGAFRDCKNIIRGSAWLAKFFTVFEGGHYVQGANGSVIEFNSYDDEQDARNGKRDYLFINEANGVAYEIYWQLAIRTRRQVFIDYNPSARFWAHDRVIGREGVKLIISDHRLNVFLSQGEHDRIEGIGDRELWRVYARGLTGKIEGLVLTNYDIVDDLPPRERWRAHGWGLDWGFTNDPTALVFFCVVSGELYVDELLYRTGMVNPDIAKEMGKIGITRNDMVVADSAEQKSIKELCNLGYWVMPCSKGKDSIINGIDILKRYRIHVTRRSRNLLNELGSYSWEKTRDGRWSNKPQDGNDHAIDALRYAVAAKLGERPRVQSRGHNIRV